MLKSHFQILNHDTQLFGQNPAFLGQRRSFLYFQHLIWKHLSWGFFFVYFFDCRKQYCFQLRSLPLKTAQVFVLSLIFLWVMMEVIASLITKTTKWFSMVNKIITNKIHHTTPLSNYYSILYKLGMLSHNFSQSCFKDQPIPL